MKKKQKPKELREARRKQEKEQREAKEKRMEEQRKYPQGVVENVYKGELTLLGNMSQIPDSQKLFGAMVYLLSDNMGDEEASKFVQRVRQRDIEFSLSSVQPKGCLPTPKAYLMREANRLGDNYSKQIYSNLKPLDYLSEEGIANLLRKPGQLCSELNIDYIKIETAQQVHVNTLVEPKANENAEDSNNHIFSVQQTICMHGNEAVHSFEFLLKTDDSTIISLMESRLHHVFTLGRRSSQGYNLFELSSFSKHKIAQTTSRTFLNLGMLLPDNIDFKAPQAALKLHSSERRPYLRSGIAWSNEQNRGHFISFIAPGSVIVLSKDGSVAKAGKSIDAPIAKHGEIVFGNAFQYPLEVKYA